MTTEQLRLHPLCAAFPKMAGDEFADLVTSVKAHGQREPIVTLDGYILDGQNRALACQHVGVEPITIEYDGEVSEAALRSFVIDRNLTRRQLEPGQRAMIAAELADWRLGANQHAAEGELINSPTSLAEAARQMKVGRDTVVRARRLKASGEAKLVEEVRQGRKTLNAALNEAAARQAPPRPSPAPLARPAPAPAPQLDRVAELSKEVLALRAENEKLRAQLHKATSDMDKQVQQRVDAYIKGNLDADARKALKVARNVRHTVYPLTQGELADLFKVFHPDTAGQVAVQTRGLNILLSKRTLLVAPDMPVGAVRELKPPPLPDDLDAVFAAAEAKRKADAQLRKDAKRAGQ